MSETMKIEFVALAGLPPQTLTGDSPRQAGGKDGSARTLVIFMGKDFTFSAATLHLIGDQGESLIKKAAAAVKFKGKALTALDLVAPAGLAAERLIVVGTGADGGDEKREGKSGGGLRSASASQGAGTRGCRLRGWHAAAGLPLRSI